MPSLARQNSAPHNAFTAVEDRVNTDLVRRPHLELAKQDCTSRVDVSLEGFFGFQFWGGPCGPFQVLHRQKERLASVVHSVCLAGGSPRRQYANFYRVITVFPLLSRSDVEVGSRLQVGPPERLHRSNVVHALWQQNLPSCPAVVKKNTGLVSAPREKCGFRDDDQGKGPPCPNEHFHEASRCPQQDHTLVLKESDQCACKRAGSDHSKLVVRRCCCRHDRSHRGE
mmetsp:Transcript_28316/g.74326  ORF Transcript_28316/g.74326 Transcript_28316/m.74326 type:complete len:226 (-) Transcript_28316:1967-2644(-)